MMMVGFCPYPVSRIARSAHPVSSSIGRFSLSASTVAHPIPRKNQGTHTTPVDTDMVAVWFGPFGDVYRHDKRKPFVCEGYVDINPLDAKELGIEDGDYVHIDSDPSDRPYRNAKPGTLQFKTARLLCRARYCWGTPRGVARMWYNMFGAALGSVKGHVTRPDGLAKNPETNFHRHYRKPGFYWRRTERLHRQGKNCVLCIRPGPLL